MSKTFDPIFDSVNELPPLTLIGASAGTGKTWTVTHIAARWLIEAEGRSPASVLMVTFARDVAGELKGRLRERLEEMKKELDDKSSSEPWALQLRQFADEIGFDVVRKRLNRILNDIDNLNARTIHSFATAISRTGETFVSDSKMLRSRAVNEAIVSAGYTEHDSLVALLEGIDVDGDPVTRLAEMIDEALSVVLPLGGFGPHSLAGFLQASKVEDLDSTANIFRNLLTDAARREEAMRELSSSQTYDAVIGELVSEINRDSSAVRERIGAQFELVIIDEFQDTDSAQWRIFSRLFIDTDKPVPVLVVGDAKQAIYGFRGGDVTIMQALKKEVSSKPGYAYSTLPVNHRSHSGLLEQINSFYIPEESPHVFLSGDADSMISYETMLSSKRLEDGLGLFQIRDIRNVENKIGNEEPVYLDLISEIQRLTTASSLCDPRELPDGDVARRWNYSDIVILCRGGVFIKMLQRELSYFGIPYVTPKSISVFSSIAAQEVRTLFWALSNPSDQRRWRTLLATWFSWMADSELTAVGLAALLESHGVSSVQREVTSGWFLKGQLQHRKSQRDITDIEHIFTVIASEFPNGATAPEILSWLENAIANANNSDDGIDGQRRIESDENAVRLMTIHASKGLQFPVVLVADIETVVQDPLVLSQNTKTGKLVDLDSVKLSAAERKDAIRQQVLEESDRLIYVALTRATNVLTCWVGYKDLEKSTPAWNALVSPWLSPLGAESAPRESKTAEPLVIQVEQQHFDSNRPKKVSRSNQLVGVNIKPIRRSSFEPNHRWSYSSLQVHGTSQSYSTDYTDSRTGAESLSSDSQETAKGRRGYSTFSNLRGNNLGDAVHGVFENVVGKIPAEHDDLIQRVIEREFRAKGLEAPEAMLPVFKRLLTTGLGSAWNGATLDDYSRAAVAVSPEMRFTMPLTPASEDSRDDLLIKMCQLVVECDADGPFVEHFRRLAESKSPGRLLQGFLTGSIDLVAPVLNHEKRFILLDYKSNSLTVTRDFSAASLSIEMAASGYPLQALIYSVALHRHLCVWQMGYEPSSHLGGATYYYVRGAGLPDAQPGEGVFHWNIPSELTLKTSELLRGPKS